MVLFFKPINPNTMPKENRGFATMDPEQQKAIARKGGETLSRNRAHMAEIGRKGGTMSRKKKQESNGEVDQTSKD